MENKRNIIYYYLNNFIIQNLTTPVDNGLTFTRWRLIRIDLIDFIQDKIELDRFPGENEINGK